MAERRRCLSALHRSKRVFSGSTLTPFFGFYRPLYDIKFRRTQISGIQLLSYYKSNDSAEGYYFHEMSTLQATTLLSEGLKITFYEIIAYTDENKYLQIQAIEKLKLLPTLILFVDKIQTTIFMTVKSNLKI